MATAPVDQMVQSARSGKQNILEASKAAVTSKETEIKLTNVARAFLKEGGLRERMTRARLQSRGRNP